VIPALKAARTAFNFPLVSVSGASSTRRLRGPSSKPGGFLPRRCCSTEATATNWSSSASVSCFIAFGKSLGRTCRTAAVVAGDDGGGVAGGEECSRAVENRSGVVRPVRSVPMVLSCRRHRMTARAMPCFHRANTVAGKHLSGSMSSAFASARPNYHVVTRSHSVQDSTSVFEEQLEIMC
jgi:hypothetical protein